MLATPIWLGGHLVLRGVACQVVWMGTARKHEHGQLDPYGSMDSCHAFFVVQAAGVNCASWYGQFPRTLASPA